MKLYKHWVVFDTINKEKVTSFLQEGSNFSLIRFYSHPTKFSFMIIEIESPNCYQDLDLCVNSLSSPLRRLQRKPSILGKGLSVEQFESIYGKLQEEIA